MAIPHGKLCTEKLLQYCINTCTFLSFHLRVFVHECHSFQQQKVLVYYENNSGYQLNYFWFTTLSELQTNIVYIQFIMGTELNVLSTV